MAEVFVTVQKEQATVYRASNGRRYFTLKAACKQSASDLMRHKRPCTCEAPDISTGYGGYTCNNHEGWIEERDQIADELYKKYSNHL